MALFAQFSLKYINTISQIWTSVTWLRRKSDLQLDLDLNTSDSWLDLDLCLHEDKQLPGTGGNSNSLRDVGFIYFLREPLFVWEENILMGKKRNKRNFYLLLFISESGVCFWCILLGLACEGHFLLLVVVYVIPPIGLHCLILNWVCIVALIIDNLVVLIQEKWVHDRMYGALIHVSMWATDHIKNLKH